LPAVPAPAVADAETRISIVGAGPLADALFQAAQGRLDRGATRSAADGLVGLLAGDAMLALTDGRSATRLAADLGRRELAIIDRFAPARLNASQPLPLAYAMAEGASAEWRDRAPALLAALGFHPLPMQDAPGLVVARTLAMLVNEAADALNQGVCTRAGADAAMKLGVNYPQGPFEWLAAWDADEARGAAAIAALLDALDAQHRGERYRVSAWLRRRADAARVA
jgi:3-hydroxybutyryl-CoA dehydrogenase